MSWLFRDVSMKVCVIYAWEPWQNIEFGDANGENTFPETDRVDMKTSNVSLNIPQYSMVFCCWFQFCAQSEHFLLTIFIF